MQDFRKSVLQSSLWLKDISQDTFSWSAGKHRLFHACRRAYLIRYYIAQGGWDAGASQIARKMVTVYGTSDRLGSISFESGHDEIFIGRSMAQAKPYSERVAAQIDEEVKSIVDAAYERCEDILSRDQKHLIAVAEFLLAHETMSAEEFEAVFTDEAAGHDKI